MDHETQAFPRKAAVFGASGGIGAALCRLLAGQGVAVTGFSRTIRKPAPIGIEAHRFDLEDEASIAAAAGVLKEDMPDLVIVATGVLRPPGRDGPEKSLGMVDPLALARMMALNAAGPLLVAKHVLPFLPRGRRSVFAALSARVGSISDNRLGGWYSYRASKAALNMMLRSAAIEIARTHPDCVIAGLHPGTVDTRLSAPFQRNVPADTLFSPDRAAAHLLDVIRQLRAKDSGEVFAWNGERIPF